MDGNGWTEHAHLIRVNALMRRWRRDLQCIRDMILDGDIIPLTLERKTPEGFLCGHVVDMGGFEPRPWKQFGAELEVYFDQNEIERIEREDPEVIAPPPPPAFTAPPGSSWGVPKAPPATPSPTAVSAPSRDHTKAQDRIADLKRQLEEARQREEALTAKLYELEEHKGPGDDGSGDLPRNAKANQGKEEKTAKEWAKSLEAAVVLAVECALTGKPKSTAQHRDLWRKCWPDSTAAEPRKDAFAAFRRALPAGLKGD